jgi:hypothetical protein
MRWPGAGGYGVENGARLRCRRLGVRRLGTAGICGMRNLGGTRVGRAVGISQRVRRLFMQISR